MARIIAYLRVSTEQQDTTRQLNLIKSYCKENDHQLVKVIEEKVTGTKGDRKGLLELLQCDESIGDMVIVSEQSRFSREKNLVKVLLNISDVLDNGLDLMFLDNPNKVYKAGETLEFTDIIILLSGAMVANAEKDKIITRMKTGKYSVFELNPYSYLGGIIPFGFDIVPNPLYDGKSKQPKQIIQINPQQSIVIKEMFELYNSGVNSTNIHKFLLSKGYRFRLDTILHLLKNPIYYGNRKMKNINCTIDGIISKELFDAVQLQIKQNRLVIKNNYVNSNYVKGLFKCQCGKYSMTLQCKEGLVYYVCYSKMSDNIKCCYNGIAQSIVYKAVYHSYINNIGLSEYSEHTDKRVKEINNDISILNGKLELLNKELLQLVKEKTKLIDAILETDNKELKEEFNKRYEQLQKVEKQLNNDIRNNDLEIAQLTELIKTITSNTNNVLKPNDDDLEVLYNRAIKTIVYNSTIKYRGILAIIYKNGLNDIYLICNSTGKSKKFIIRCPNSFKYNLETGKIEVEFMKPVTNMNFDITEFETKEFGFMDIFETFNTNEWENIL